MTRDKLVRVLAVALLMLMASAASASLLKKKQAPPAKQGETLQQYLTRLMLSPVAQSAPTPGSLFTATGLLADPVSDYRARAVGDTLAVQIVESTTISQSGSLAAERDFTHSSAVTGVGGLTPSFLNPLLAANSTTKLNGTGATASSSSLNTTLTALVVAVLPNGLLVVEAHRQVAANQQHESVTLRGIVRPADIAPNNTVYSYQLFNLELDVKGKGVISDTVRQPNIVVRTLLRALNF